MKVFFLSGLKKAVRQWIDKRRGDLLLPSGDWSEKFIVRTVRIEQNKTYLIDPQSNLKDYRELPPQLNVTQEDKIVIGTLCLGADLTVLESYINLSTTEQTMIDKPGCPLGNPYLSFFQAHTHFATLCVVPFLGTVLAFIAFFRLCSEKTKSLYGKYQRRFVIVGIAPFIICFFALFVPPIHRLFFFTELLPFVLAGVFAGAFALAPITIPYGLLLDWKKRAAAEFLSTGREAFYRNFRSWAELSLTENANNSGYLKVIPSVCTEPLKKDSDVPVLTESVVEGSEPVKQKSIISDYLRPWLLLSEQCVVVRSKLAKELGITTRVILGYEKAGMACEGVPWPTPLNAGEPRGRSTTTRK